jgi:hypothetical protein
VSWPFTPSECPRCWYFQKFDLPYEDDIGYEIVGFCRQPRIAMDLFRFRERPEPAHCPLFYDRGGERAPG